eukprot:513467-Prymnesium_polylepis.1
MGELWLEVRRRDSNRAPVGLRTRCIPRAAGRTAVRQLPRLTGWHLHVRLAVSDAAVVSDFWLVDITFDDMPDGRRARAASR